MRARPLTTLLLSSAVALGIAPTAGAATVKKVVDGNTIRVGAKTYDMLGVDVPACHAKQARAALKRLLPRNANVRLKRDGAGKGRYVYRNHKLVNAALLKSGAARAGDLTHLKLAATLTAAQQAAQQAKRGLWTACAQPEDPRARARTDLAGRAFTRITATTFSSSETHLHLCADGRFVEDVSTYSEFGSGSEYPLPDSDATHRRYGGTWEVLAAEYRTEGAAARVRRVYDDGTESVLDFVATASGVTVNGASVSTQTSAVCR